MKKFFKTHAKLCIAVLALSLVTVGATLALMVSASNSVTNQFTAGDVNTHIEEVLTEGNKRVSIKNDGPSDAYVRARIMVSGVDPDNVEIVASDPTPAESGKVYLVMQNNGDSSGKWTKVGADSDDFYYYLGVLKAGEATPNLLEKVVLGSKLAADEDFLANFTVTIYHESVLAIDQSNPINVAKVEAAFDAAVGTTSNP